jgi:hypothetical protein
VELLLACWQYGLLTAGDFQHLLMLRSRSHVRTLLGELCRGERDAKRGYLFRVPLPHARPGGTEHVYFLGSRGRHYLAREEGLPVTGYWRPPGKAQQLTFGRLLHDLAVNRFLICLRSWCNSQQDIRLAEFRTQDEIAREPLLAEAANNSTAEEGPSRVVPDAWVNVQLLNPAPPHKSSPLLIEIDRGTTWRQVFSQRVAARLSYIRPNGLYRKIFATDRVRILYLTTGCTRRDTLARWCQQTLADEDREDWARVFLFAEASFATMYETAHSLFSDAVWVIPGQHTPVRLFGEERNYAGTRAAAGTQHDGLTTGTGGLLAGCAGGSAHGPLGGADESMACLRYS